MRIMFTPRKNHKLLYRITNRMAWNVKPYDVLFPYFKYKERALLKNNVFYMREWTMNSM